LPLNNVDFSQKEKEKQVVVLDICNIKKGLPTINNIFEEFELGTVSCILKFGIFNTLGLPNKIKQRKINCNSGVKGWHKKIMR